MKLGCRKLRIVVENHALDLPIDMFAPEQDPSGGWSCRYSIGWPHGTFKSRGWGSDSLQAVSLTLKKIGGELYTSRYHQSGQLVWRERGRGYGFPVASELRDLLVGDDKTFDG